MIQEDVLSKLGCTKPMKYVPKVCNVMIHRNMNSDVFEHFGISMNDSNISVLRRKIFQTFVT